MRYILDNAMPILLAGGVGSALLRLFWPRRMDGRAIAGTFVALCWLAAILAGALILAPVTAGKWTVALGSAAIIWIGFVLPATVVTLRARRVAWGQALGDAGAWLAVMLAQAATMQVVGLVRPG